MSMGMRNAGREVKRSLVLMAAAVLLVSCGERGTEKLTDGAVQQLEEITKVGLPLLQEEKLVEAEFVDSSRQVVERFRKNGDMESERERGKPNILQIACLFKKRELVQSLLEQGADPNAHSLDDESPLLLAVGTYLLPETTTEQIIPVVDTLLAGGHFTGRRCGF